VTYYLGQRATLNTIIRDEAGNPADSTVALTLTAPDGTVTTPTVNHDGTGLYSAAVTFDQAGDWLRVWNASGAIVAVDADQVHVIAAALRIVGLAEVKEHGNITSSTYDRELLDFIGTAQQMIEDEVGATVPRTVTETIYANASTLLLGEGPVISVQQVTEYGNTVDPAAYILNTATSAVMRTDGRCWYGSTAYPVTVVYRVGQAPIPEAIRWAGKELTIHLWRSTQAQRGGRGRGEAAESAASFGLPNRVRDALAPFARGPVVA
jgi:hypothetical protein